jgi:Secretion system C-terminal sorting domain/PKD domain
MKGILHAMGRTVSSRTVYFAFLFLFFFTFSFSVRANTVVIGTGSGALKQNNMNGLNPGDTLAINPGSYNDGIFSHMTGITIINHGGLVVFTSTVYCANNTSVNFVGTGAPGITYGFRFNVGSNNIGSITLDGHIENSTWSNMEFLNCGADAFGNQNYQTTYDGVNDNTKRLLNCKITNIHMDNCGAFMANFRGQFINVIDKCEFSNIIIDHSKVVQIMNVVAFYRSSIHHWTIGQQVCGPPTDAQGHTLDQGCFEIYGSPEIYDCSEIGQNYGWFMRITQQGLMGPQDSHVYNNIRVGSTNYGFIDYRQDVTGYTITTPPYCRGGDMYIVNNTVGNMVTTNNYLTPVVVAYNFAGQHMYVYNNLRFNSKNQNGVPDSANVVHYGSSADFLVESNDKYYANPITAGVLTDTINCFLKAGSPVIDKGMNVSFVTTDFGGISRPQGSAYDIGAREYDQNTPPNQPPVAVVGAAQTITLPTNSAQLDGSKSYDPDGTISAYSWSLVSGPGATFTSASAAATSVTGLKQGTYIFKLQVTDNGNAIGTALDTVIVNAAADQPPVAVVGAAQTITLPINSAQLDGSKSYDPDGTISAYSWSLVSGPGATVTNASAAATSVTGLKQGTYIFKLQVTDNGNAVGTALDTVIVNAAVNQPPVAVAGSNQTITLPTNSVTLDGSKSYDPDGSISAYAWSVISGPGATLTNASAASTVATGLSQGTYIFKLQVTDNSNATASVLDTVIVNPTANQPPVANAGSSINITLPLDSVKLNGSLSSDPDNNIAGYTWSEVSGPSAVLVNANSAVAEATSLLAGQYIFQLTVTDSLGASSQAQVKVKVAAAVVVGLQPPSANAGADQTITLPTSSTTLNGSASVATAGGIISYAWSESSGPASASFGTAGNAVTTVSGLQQGTYIFKLTIEDSSGAFDSDSVTVKVNPAPNKPPVANAGPDQSITLPTNSVQLDGSLSADPDGSIASYSWIKVSGPGAISINNSLTVNPTATNLQRGIYVFQLTVTDNSGATSTARVTVTVNPAPPAPNQPPVANAGNNTTITLPQSSVALNGTNSSDADGSISAYGWNQVSGPSTATISAANSAKPTVSGLQAGSYVFQLTVTDNDGATAKDQVTVTVNQATPSANQPPVANAGNDLTITLPQSSVSLNGSSSFDPDGSISVYGWNQVSGPSTAGISAANSASPTVSGLQAGSYVFQLTVTDNDGATAKDQVTVTVNDATESPDVAPVANAGTDTTITLPTNSILLDGNGSWDVNGTITSYQWQQMSGPNSASLSSFNSSTPMVTGLEEGKYEFMLTVKDAKGASSTASVRVNVIKATQNGDEIVLYPNPAHSLMNLRLTSEAVGTVQVLIYSVNGQLVQTNQMSKDGSYIDNQINVSQLAIGMYVMHVVIGHDKMMLAKFIKQ